MARKLVLATLACAVLMAPAAVFAADRVSASEKGSILIYPKIELRWDSTGNLIQDTFIDLTNDHQDLVEMKGYYVNGDGPLDADPGATPPERAHKGWNSKGFSFDLTGNQPSYWSAATGQPGPDQAVAKFTSLDPGSPNGRPDPDGSSDRVLRGYLIVWATTDTGEEIRWNHLKGDAVIINYMAGAAWEYTTFAYATGTNNVANGAETDGTPGQLKM
ncbi:MAG: hypothetical protein GY842_04735, partial [bacterium]|nr:hypothetical protein [bacterium]